MPARAISRMRSYKTAEYLGADRREIDKRLDAFKRALPDPLTMNHNQYFRFISLSSEITRRAGGTELSVLDVGGGEGQLAAFIPNASYCLAEPNVNGISGTELPFSSIRSITLSPATFSNIFPLISERSSWTNCSPGRGVGSFC